MGKRREKKPPVVSVIDILDNDKMKEFLFSTCVINEVDIPKYKNFLVQWSTRESPIYETYGWLRCVDFAEAQHIVNVVIDKSLNKLLFLGEKDKIDLDIEYSPKYFKGKTLGYRLTKQEFDYLRTKHKSSVNKDFPHLFWTYGADVGSRHVFHKLAVDNPHFA